MSNSSLPNGYRQEKRERKRRFPLILGGERRKGEKKDARKKRGKEKEEDKVYPSGKEGQKKGRLRKHFGGRTPGGKKNLLSVGRGGRVGGGKGAYLPLSQVNDREKKTKTPSELSGKKKKMTNNAGAWAI